MVSRAAQKRSRLREKRKDRTDDHHRDEPAYKKMLVEGEIDQADFSPQAVTSFNEEAPTRNNYIVIKKEVKNTSDSSSGACSQQEVQAEPQTRESYYEFLKNEFENLGRPLTRKEQHRLDVAKRLDGQLARAACLSSSPAAGEAAEGESAKEVKPRHADRYIGGTFWRERKERKKKTLFVGNIPLRFDQYAVKDMICTLFPQTTSEEQSEKLLETENKGTDALKDILHDGVYGPTCPVLSVDFLSVRKGAKTRHAYVAFRTLDLAREAKELLNGYQPISRDNNRLRVNFSDDKVEREKAIKKREGSKHLPAARGRGSY